MGLKLHGMKASTCTRRVITVLNEKNVSYEFVPVDLYEGEQQKPEFLAMQPFGKVPVLDDDGFKVYESRAICKYIAKKYAGQGTKLIPDDSDLKAYGLFEQAASIEGSYFDGPASGIAFEKVFKPMKKMGATDEATVQKLGAQLDTALAGYEKILSKQPYLAGNEITVADLFHLPYGKMAKDLGFSGTFEKYPAVNKWFDGLAARESWVKANA